MLRLILLALPPLPAAALTEPAETTLEPSSTAAADPLGSFRVVVEALRPSLVVITGDMAEAQWELVTAELRGASHDLSFDLVLVPGNHDYHFRQLAARSAFSETSATAVPPAAMP